MHRFVGMTVVLAGACGEAAPVITNLACTPAPLSVASPARPYRVSCTVEVDGKVGDVFSTARGPDGDLWATDHPSIGSVTSDKLLLWLSNDEAPPLGVLTISVTVDHPQGIDGPGDDTATSSIEVIP